MQVDAHSTLNHGVAKVIVSPNIQDEDACLEQVFESLQTDGKVTLEGLLVSMDRYESISNLESKVNRGLHDVVINKVTEEGNKMMEQNSTSEAIGLSKDDFKRFFKVCFNCSCAASNNFAIVCRPFDSETKITEEFSGCHHNVWKWTNEGYVQLIGYSVQSQVSLVVDESDVKVEVEPMESDQLQEDIKDDVFVGINSGTYSLDYDMDYVEGAAEPDGEEEVEGNEVEAVNHERAAKRARCDLETSSEIYSVNVVSYFNGDNFDLPGLT
jgi:hypothetical protein